jgi:hypothetical protein
MDSDVISKTDTIWKQTHFLEDSFQDILITGERKIPHEQLIFLQGRGILKTHQYLWYMTISTFNTTAGTGSTYFKQTFLEHFFIFF